MSFLQPYFLFLLLIPLVLGLLFLRQHQQRAFVRSLLVSQRHAHRLVHQVSAPRRVLPRLFVLLALSLAILALARPYNGFSPGSTTSAARNIFIALDISRSMTTEDVGGSRLDQAKTAACELVSSLPEDKLGMIVFSGESQVIIPLTYDHTALKHYLNQADPSWMEHGGTNFASVLNTCTEYYSKHAPTGTNAVIIISDGEDTSEETQKAAGDVQENQLLVITVGTGSVAGQTIPDASATDGIWRDRNGQAVISKLNPEALANFAQTTGGKFIHLTESTNLNQFVSEAVSTLDMHQGGFAKAEIPNDLYMYFALPALVLLLAGIVVGTEWRQVRAPLLLVLMLQLPGLHAAESERVEEYAAALQKSASHEYRAATDLLARALLTENRELQAAAYLAIGNACTQHSFARLRELYQAESPDQDGKSTPSPLSALMPPARPEPGQLREIAKALRADIRSYDDALAINPELTQARDNKQRVEKFIQLLEEAAKEEEKQNPPPSGGGNKDKKDKQDSDQPPPGDSEDDDQTSSPEEGDGTQPPPQQGDKKPTGQQAPPSAQGESERQRTESLLNMYTDEEAGSPIPSTGGQFEPPAKDY